MRPWQRPVELRCMTCDRPKWQHERDKFGNIVRKPEYRDNSSPPICVPGDRLARKLDTPFGRAAFGRRVA
jgi:hypothetical protein